MLNIMYIHKSIYIGTWCRWSYFFI